MTSHLKRGNVPKQKRKMKNKISHKNKTTILVNLSILIIVLIYLNYFSLNKLENYTNWFGFTFFLLFIGLALGIIVYKIVLYLFPSFKEFKINKKQNPIGLKLILVTMIVLVVFGLGTLLNNTIVSKSELVDFKMEKVSLRTKTKGPSYLFIKNKQNKNERLQFGKKFLKSVENNKIVNLRLNTGILGFDFYTIK